MGSKIVLKDTSQDLKQHEGQAIWKNISQDFVEHKFPKRYLIKCMYGLQNYQKMQELTGMTDDTIA